jgi:(p)ppGpp synthase/HD superfamily hydrolase
MLHLTNPLVAHAADYAKIVHASQQRKYTGEPYFNHLVEVAVTLEWADCRPEVVAAGYLHDSIEDTSTTSVDLQHLFGPEVARLVEQVTDVSRPGDGNRAFRKKLDAEHLARATPEAMTIKLADILSNTRSIVECDPNFAKTYLKEKKFLLPLLSRGNNVLWQIANEFVNRAVV